MYCPVIVAGSSHSTTNDSRATARNSESPAVDLRPSASASGFPRSASTQAEPAQLALSQSDAAIREASSTEFSSIQASGSNYSIWPEDLVNRSSDRISLEPDATFERVDDITSAANMLSQVTLGEYHSARLAVHDRSDTSSPSAVSNSELDEDDDYNREGDRQPYRRSLPSRRSTSADLYPQHVHHPVLWTSNSHEEVNMNRDNVIAHKHGWKGSSTGEPVQGEGQDIPMVNGHSEGHEPVANRIPNEIVMHVSHPRT